MASLLNDEIIIISLRILTATFALVMIAIVLPYLLSTGNLKPFISQIVLIFNYLGESPFSVQGNTNIFDYNAKSPTMTTDTWLQLMRAQLDLRTTVMVARYETFRVVIWAITGIYIAYILSSAVEAMKANPTVLG